MARFFVETSTKGRVALVTGASRGIGRAIALAFAHSGIDVVVAYHQKRESAEAVAQAIRTLGRRSLAARVDIAGRDCVRQLVHLTKATFGRIDILVNNAGILQQKPFLEISEEDWDRMLDVNLKGSFLCSQEVFPVMQKQGTGRIINIASSGGQMGGPLAVHYSASKAAIISLTKSLARIGAPFGILANCIAPGLIDTEMAKGEIHSEVGREKIGMIPLRRAGKVEEVAQLAVFLASDGAAYITGQTLNVNGGLYMG